MSKINVLRLIIVVAILEAILAVVIVRCSRSDKESATVTDSGLSLPYNNVVHDTIRDTIPVYTSKVVRMDREDYTEAADRNLLADLSIKPAQVYADQLTETVITDSVQLSRTLDSMIYVYQDRWAMFRLNLADTSLAYHVRDSVSTIVYREYRHRFLWWRWGTKGYRIKITNFNPNSTLLYNQYILVD